MVRASWWISDSILRSSQIKALRRWLPSRVFWGLVDTGAGESCIDDQLGIRLGLPIIDQRDIAGISGVKKANMYLAQIHIPSLSYTIYGSFAGVDLVGGGQVHQVLVGRTFLSAFKMVYDGTTGDVTITGS